MLASCPIWTVAGARTTVGHTAPGSDGLAELEVAAELDALGVDRFAVFSPRPLRGCPARRAVRLTVGDQFDRILRASLIRSYAVAVVWRLFG
jgi:hypothetical protein